MAFIARVEKPCTVCSVVIPKGTTNGFTWDRTKGGFVHVECIKARKAGTVRVQFPCAGCGDTLTGETVTENSKTYHAKCLPKSTTHYCAGLGCTVVVETVGEFCTTCKRDNVPPELCSLCLSLLGAGHKPGCDGKTYNTGKTTAEYEAERAAKLKGKPVKDNAADELARIIQQLAGARGIDEKEVRRIAADEASKVSSNRTITIKVGETPEIKLDLAHKDLPLLVRLVSAYGANGHRPNVYMHGPAGSGKSTAARQASEVLKLPYGYISLNPQTPDSRLLGYMHAGGEYVPSEFFRRYTEGGVFCIDEIDNAAASLVTTLNGLLENGHGAFPHGVFQRHKDFVCVCTANTIGRGGDINYPERRALDGAFLERFLFVEWAYDMDLTKAIVTGIIGAAAPEFMEWVASEARGLQARFPTLIVSPRASIQGAVLEKMGLSRNQIMPMVIARGLK